MAGIIRPVIGSTADVAEKCYFIDGNKIAYELGKAYISNGSTLELLWEAGGSIEYVARGIIAFMEAYYYNNMAHALIDIDESDNVSTPVVSDYYPMKVSTSQSFPHYATNMTKDGRYILTHKMYSSAGVTDTTKYVTLYKLSEDKMTYAEIQQVNWSEQAKASTTLVSPMLSVDGVAISGDMSKAYVFVFDKQDYRSVSILSYQMSDAGLVYEKCFDKVVTVPSGSGGTNVYTACSDDLSVIALSIGKYVKVLTLQSDGTYKEVLSVVYSNTVTHFFNLTPDGKYALIGGTIYYINGTSSTKLGSFASFTADGTEHCMFYHAEKGIIEVAGATKVNTGGQLKWYTAKVTPTSMTDLGISYFKFGNSYTSGQYNGVYDISEDGTRALIINDDDIYYKYSSGQYFTEFRYASVSRDSNFKIASFASRKKITLNFPDDEDDDETYTYDGSIKFIGM